MESHSARRWNAWEITLGTTKQTTLLKVGAFSYNKLSSETWTNAFIHLIGDITYWRKNCHDMLPIQELQGLLASILTVLTSDLASSCWWTICQLHHHFLCDLLAHYMSLTHRAGTQWLTAFIKLSSITLNKSHKKLWMYVFEYTMQIPQLPHMRFSQLKKQIFWVKLSIKSD